MKRLFLVTILAIISLACFGQSEIRVAAFADMRGRSLVGTLPTPTIKSEIVEGVVVVAVKVDQYGYVVDAIPGEVGTTLADEEVWRLCGNAARKANFNASSQAPDYQKGKISYTFSKRGTVFTSLKELVEQDKRGELLIKGVLEEVYNYGNLVILVEEDEYIIPVQLSQLDLGAEKRFRSLGLHQGDTLSIKGIPSSLFVKGSYYKGLEGASIIDISRRIGEIPDSASVDGATDQIFEFKPSFKGGDANEFSKWVNMHLIYPKKAKENGVQGRVSVKFTIDVDGRVKDVEVINGVEPSLNAEAVRVVSSSPKWEPARQGGKPIAVTYFFPVVFQLR